MAEYEFPMFTTGYHGNIILKILYLIGLECYLYWDSSTNILHVVFDIELTPEQYNLIAPILNDPNTSGLPGLPNFTGTRFTVADIFANRETFRTGIGGLNFCIFYSETVPGSGEFDKAEIHFQNNLTVQQRNNVRTGFSTLLTEV